MEDIFESAGHDTLMLIIAFDTGHGVGLTGTSLTVSEDCTVVALKDIRNDGSGSVIVDFDLTGAQVICNIKSELFGSLIDEGLFDKDFTFLGDIDN